MGRGSGHEGDGDVTVNQITWQCGSLQEVMQGETYFAEHEVPYPAHRSRRPRQQLAYLCLGPRRPHQRALLRH